MFEDMQDTPVYDEYLRMLRNEIEWQANKPNNWAEYGHRIYPSDLHFGICIRDLIYDVLPTKKVNIGLEGKLLTERGKAYHWMVQRRLVKSKRMCREPIELSEAVQDELAHKLLEKYPEQPVRDHQSGLSGWADLPPWMFPDGRFAVVDIKTYNPKTQEAWDELKAIPKKYLTQMCLYAEVWNRQKCWPKPVDTLHLHYANERMFIQDGLRVKELTRAYDDRLKELAGGMLDTLELVRNTYIAGEQCECTDPICYKHTKKQFRL